jgi:predicted nuclease of predicted toxin-antitoxin system
MSISNFLLDENISPSLVRPLWAEGIDTIHVRDRGLLGAADSVIWARAMEQARTVVTIDLDDFVFFALREKTHPGILAIPSGGSRKEQLNYVMTAVTLASASGSNARPFTNQCVEVSLTGDVRFEELTLLDSNRPNL